MKVKNSKKKKNLHSLLSKGFLKHGPYHGSLSNACRSFKYEMVAIKVPHL